MGLTRAAAKLHKWLALVVSLPILAWFASGLFIAFVPEAAIHGHDEHAAPAPVDPAAIAEPLAAVLAGHGRPVERIDIRSMLGRPVVLLSPGEGRPTLVDLTSGRALSPIDRTTAAALARAALGPRAGAPLRITAITAPLRAYAGPLPAWRVDFADEGQTQVYVAADLGRVVATRNRLFRLFDVMWSLHILNFEDPRGINTPWLWGAAAVALAVALSGVIMLPGRLGLRRRKRNV